MAKGFGVSPITNTIYYGTQDPERHIWTGKKEDVTDDAIAAVYEWYDFSIVAETHAYEMLGNGWTVEVIKYLLSHTLE